LCQEKLALAHPKLVAWFCAAKTRNPSMHVSWSYRDETSQKNAFAIGASKLHYPMSAHNKEPAMALDIFQIDDSGKAVFDPVFCAKLADEIRRANLPFIWGGNFKSLGDNDHFQYHPDSVS
jgi:hypothetical protein